MVADERERQRSPPRGPRARRAEREGGLLGREAVELADGEVKPNYRSLGPRVGSRKVSAWRRDPGARPRDGGGRERPRRADARRRPRQGGSRWVADDLSLVMLPRGAISSRARPTTPSRCELDLDDDCAARVSPGRSCTRSRTLARRRPRGRGSHRAVALRGQRASRRGTRVRGLRGRRDAGRQARTQRRDAEHAHVETARIDGSDSASRSRGLPLSDLLDLCGRGQLDSPSGWFFAPCAVLDLPHPVLLGQDHHRRR